MIDTTPEAEAFFRSQIMTDGTAHKLAQAEAWAKDKGLRFQWGEDWDVASHVEEFPDAYDVEPETCEWVEAIDPETGATLASLGCIDDATEEYRRVVEAELAYEAMPAWFQPPLPFDVEQAS